VAVRGLAAALHPRASDGMIETRDDRSNWLLKKT